MNSVPTILGKCSFIVLTLGLAAVVVFAQQNRGSLGLAEYNVKEVKLNQTLAEDAFAIPH